MFHAASLKALLPPGEGGADEINIVIGNLLAKIINHLKKPMAGSTFLGSCAFTKHVVRPPQSHRLHRGDEKEPPGGKPSR
jgi:hypothetical protein